jgi:tRNA pseudouridine55 synthase
MATGVLPVAFGNATRLADHLPLTPKRYVARLRLGEATDSADADGRVVESRPVPVLPSASELDQLLLRSFVGRVTQTPPRFSAVRINGERAYDLARRDVDFVVPSREVTVHSCSARAVRADELELDVLCGAGTYVRSLGEEIARALGTCGHLVALHRSGSGMFQDGARAFYTTEELLAHLPRLDSPLHFGTAARLVAQGTRIEEVLRGARVPEEPGNYALFASAGADEPVALALVGRVLGASRLQYVANLCLTDELGRGNRRGRFVNNS